MNAKKGFHSSYIIDVSPEPDNRRVRLTDSMRSSWFVDTGSQDVKSDFRRWLEHVFFKGVPNTLTVFEYEDRGSDADIENYVVRFVSPDVSGRPAENAPGGV